MSSLAAQRCAGFSKRVFKDVGASPDTFHCAKCKLELYNSELADLKSVVADITKQMVHHDSENDETLPHLVTTKHTWASVVSKDVSSGSINRSSQGKAKHDSVSWVDRCCFWLT